MTITRERDCLGHDDRLESLAGAVSIFAPQLGVDPLGIAVQSREEREMDEIERLMAEDDEAVGRPGKRADKLRPEAANPQRR